MAETSRRSGLILPFEGAWPQIAPDAFIADNATLIGNVDVGAGASIWFGVVIRADVGRIHVGARTNLQDGTIVHVNGAGIDTTIGADCLIGHAVTIHGCTIEDGAFIGMNAVILDDAVVEGGAMVAAGALVTPGKRVKRGELWAGSPAKPMRALSEAEIAGIPLAVAHYAELAQKYMKERG